MFVLMYHQNNHPEPHPNVHNWFLPSALRQCYSFLMYTISIFDTLLTRSYILRTTPLWKIDRGNSAHISIMYVSTRFQYRASLGIQLTIEHICQLWFSMPLWIWRLCVILIRRCPKRWKWLCGWDICRCQFVHGTVSTIWLDKIGIFLQVTAGSGFNALYYKIE